VQDDRDVTVRDLEAQGFKVTTITDGRGDPYMNALRQLPDGSVIRLVSNFGNTGWSLSFGSQSRFTWCTDNGRGPLKLSELYRILSESGQFVITTDLFNL